MTELHEATRAGRFFQLLLLATSTWAVIYARFTLGPLQEAMQIDLALTDNQVAWLQGPAIAVPMALASIPMGLLVDRYSRARLFVLFVALNLGAIVLTAVATHLAVLIAARCLSGLALAAILVAAYSTVADLYAPAQRGRATMVVAIGEVSAPPAAFALGGMLLAMAGASSGSWRSALLWMCVLLVPTVLLMLALREPPRTGVNVINPPLREVWPQLWRYRNVIMPLLLARVMVWIADGAVLVWGAPIFARNFALAPERIGAIMGTALLVSGISGPILGGVLADFCQRSGGPRRTMTALAVVTLLEAPAALFALAPSATLAGIVLTAFLTLGFTIGTAAIAK